MTLKPQKIMMDDDASPWIHVNTCEPPKDCSHFFAWDEQLERVIKSMQWFDGDIQDFGTKCESWSGTFEYWCVGDQSLLKSITSPYYYQ